MSFSKSISLFYHKIGERRIKRLLKIIKREFSISVQGHLAVSLAFVTKHSMRKINKAYRCQDKSTDILSFPAPQEMKKLGFLGELIICYPVLENQAQAFAHSVQDELDILLVHGVLHLIGMDHEQSIKEARFMAKWERKILIQFSTQKELGLIGRSSSGTV